MSEAAKPVQLIALPLSDETVRWLALLGDSHGSKGDETERAKAALLFTVASLVDGMRRPGAWERGVVCQLFGSDWIAYIERDPDAPHRSRIKTPEARA